MGMSEPTRHVFALVLATERVGWVGGCWVASYTTTQSGHASAPRTCQVMELTVQDRDFNSACCE